MDYKDQIPLMPGLSSTPRSFRLTLLLSVLNQGQTACHTKCERTLAQGC